MSNFKSEFSKTEHTQKTPIPIANQGQHTGAIQISTTIIKTILYVIFVISSFYAVRKSDKNYFYFYHHEKNAC